MSGAPLVSRSYSMTINAAPATGALDFTDPVDSGPTWIRWHVLVQRRHRAVGDQLPRPPASRTECGDACGRPIIFSGTPTAGG